MIVRIGRVPYHARPFDPQGEGTQAVRLTKPDGTSYDLVRTHEGLGICDCPDYVVRKDGTAKVCKHIVAVVMAGLMRAPRPVPRDGANWQVPRRDIDGSTGGTTVNADEARVKAVHPRAYSRSARTGRGVKYFVMSAGVPWEIGVLGEGLDAVEAWRDAARRIDAAAIQG